MEITKEEFMMLRDQLFDRLDKMEEMIESLSTIEGKHMLDNRDMRLLLKVCDRTLWRWRRNRQLASFKISGKIYYMAADIHKFLRSEYYQTLNNNGNEKKQ